MRAERHLKFKSRLIPVLVAALLVMQLLFPYRGWMIMLVGLGGLWLISYVWAKSLYYNLSLSREVRFGWAHVGDRLEERVTLSNAGDIPALWVHVQDHTSMPDYSTTRVTGVDGKSRNRWYTAGICTQRGIFTLGPTSLHTGDPFGLYAVSIHLPQSTTLSVMPPIVPLPHIEVATGGRAGEGRARPNSFERTVSSTQVRPYLPGDSLSWIHWPTTARQQKFFVRQFDSTPSGDWWIVLDLDARVQAGHGFTSTEEHAVILCASLADEGLRAGKTVGLAAHGAELLWLPPQEGDPQRQKIMQALALVHPGSCSLLELLRMMQPSARQIGSLILITANATGDWIEALLPLVQRGARPTILALDPATFGAPVSDNATRRVLAQLGLTHYVIPASLLDRPEARPGQQGHWDWQVSPFGRAMPASRLKDLSWKLLR